MERTAGNQTRSSSTRVGMPTISDSTTTSGLDRRWTLRSRALFQAGSAAVAVEEVRLEFSVAVTVGSGASL